MVGEIVEKRAGRVYFRLLTKFLPTTDMIKELQCHLGFHARHYGGPWDLIVSTTQDLKSKIQNVMITKWSCSLEPAPEYMRPKKIK